MKRLVTCGWYLPMTSPTTRLDFDVAAIGSQPELVHRKQDPALHGFESVAGIR